ncbi:DMT family transporter [Leeia sp. TBRC 13508]|uniref:DMT family transporter n=1 Tax=Leeia speluncae TaxID=2884804 RepID=A0ABS8DAV0_9NEIS|nr:DMT family transporter [Leeia speluncae]MCB6185128.1 DMT family transporter [Leeia speluncae]
MRDSYASEKSNMMAKTRSIFLAKASILLIPLLWSVNYYVARKAPGVIPPYMLTLIRWGIGAFVLTLLSMKEIFQFRHEICRNIHKYIIQGFCGMVVCGAWVYIGAQSTSAMNIALIYAAAPVLIAVGSFICLKERLQPYQLLGILIALLGMIHVIVKGQWQALSNLEFVIGDIWIVAATISWAVYSVLQSIWVSPLSGKAHLAVVTCASLPMIIIGTLIEAQNVGTPVINLYGVWLAFAAAIFPGVLAYLIYIWAQQQIGPNKVAITFYLGPLYASAIAWLVLNESMHLFHLQAALFILSGVYLVSRGKV